MNPNTNPLIGLAALGLFAVIALLALYLETRGPRS